MNLHIETLGPFAVSHGDVPISDSVWKTQKNKALFKILLTSRDHALNKEQLMEWLWPEMAPEAAGRNLRVAISQVRRALEPGLQRGSQSHFLLTTESGYAWNTQAGYWLDAAEFEALSSQFSVDAKTEDSERRISDAERATALYRGDYLEEDRYADWATAERERLREIYFALLTEMAETHARQGRYQRAISLCREVLAADRCRESVWGQLMLYHYHAGDQALALRAYEECQQTLMDELGVEPLPETNALADQIQRRQVAGARTYPPSPDIERLQRLPLSLGQTPFVGRDAEVAWLAGQVEQATVGHGRLVLIQGEAGVGKTRLIQEFFVDLQEAFKAGILHSHCQELGLPYQPWAEIVRMGLESLRQDDLRAISLRSWAALAELVPELRARIPNLPENPPLPPQQEQVRFFNAVAQFLLSLAAREDLFKPLALFLDDLHWADTGSLDLLDHLLSRIEAKPVLILATYRGEEVREGDSLSQWVRTWAAKSLVHSISLARLTIGETAELVKRFPLAVERLDRFCGQLYHETEGNPLFVISTLQHFFEEGLLRVEGQTWVTAMGDDPIHYRDLAIPPTIQSLIARRVARLSEAEEKLIRLASVIGQDFALSLLERAWEGSREECLSALASLTGAQLLVEHQDRYQFSHDKIREVVHEEMPLPRRQLLHQRVLRALEQLYTDRQELWAGSWAQHAQRAGEWKKALEYSLQALRKAANEYRRQEGLELAKLGLEATQKLEAAGEDRTYINRERFEVLAQRVAIYDLQGRRPEQEQDLAEMQRIAERLAESDKWAVVHQRAGDLYRKIGRYREAREANMKALRL